MLKEESETSAQNKPSPVLKLKFLSHGTLETTDIERARRFYEEFLGFEVVQNSPISLVIRLGGPHSMSVVRVPRKDEMTELNHNGLDVRTREEVDECHRIVVEQKDKWGIGKITSPNDLHGTYTFMFTDMDGNWWEILTNPEGGYSWMFQKGGDIKNWGWDEEEGFNPNDSKPVGRGGVKPSKMIR
jgi:catechol 2,3-dioxygenase-like lactoylglutathione lyase family enzyme